METQLDIKFTAAVDPSQAAHVAGHSQAPDTNPDQLEIAETGTNVAFRLSFNVPQFTKSGKFTGYRLEFRVISNVISQEDLRDFYHCSTDKVLASGNFVEESRPAFAKKFNLTPEQAKLLDFKGYSIAKHRPCTKVDVYDPRWV